MSDVKPVKKAEEAVPLTTQTKSTKAETSGASKSRHLLHVIFSLSLAAAIAYVAFEGYVLKQSMQEANYTLESAEKNTKNEINSLDGRLAAAQSQISENQQALKVLNNSLAQMDALQQQINQLGQTVSGANESERALWQVQELEFLLRMADERILLTNDIASATALLKTVDRQLQQISRVGVDDVRAAIARDLLSLNMASQVDVTGIYARVAAVISKRPLMTLNDATTPIEANANLDTNSWWQDVFLALGVRYTQNQSARVIPKSEAYYVGRSVDLILEESLFALSQGNNDLWSMSLSRAHNLIAKSYRDDPVKHALQDELLSLASLNIQPSTVEIGAAEASLQAFKLTLMEAN